METRQIRFTKEQLEMLQKTVDIGMYPNVSEAVRSIIREHFMYMWLGKSIEFDKKRDFHRKT